MHNRFDSFVMFAEMRTGSNFLEANLNTIPGLTCHGEVFNPHFIGQHNQTDFMGHTLAQREEAPLGLLNALRSGTDGLAGFRYFHDHDPRVLPAVLNDPRCAKIVLTRNPVESYVSWKIAQETGQWRLTNVKNLKTAQARFDPTEFEVHLSALQQFQITLMHGLQTTGQTAFYIDYEDINDLAVLNGLAAYLGVGPIESLDGRLKKQNPEEITAKVINPDAMERALTRLDRFNLSRTPNFEPRRAPMVPSFIAAGAAPLLYLPIKAGPVDAVTGWLAGFGAIESDFTQKSLRQWKRARLPHRSFTVLRHPVARAHRAFVDTILSGGFQEIRGQLERVHNLALPPAGQPYATLAEHRIGFLGFLKWLKLNLSGQTGTRVDPHWASQSAVVQGFGQFQTPDLILRERSLGAGLGLLCAEVGVACPPLPTSPPDGLLASIYDPEIEAAARDCYARDYLGFGFGNWAA